MPLMLTALAKPSSGLKSAFFDGVLIASYTAVATLAGMGLDLIRVDPLAAAYAAGIAGLLAFLSSVAAYRNLVLPPPQG